MVRRQAYQGLPVFGLHRLSDFAHLEDAAEPPGLKKVDTPPPLPTSRERTGASRTSGTLRRAR
jgi:hypothetical protein